MCRGRCTHPEKLKGEPEDCSEEQIRECHPDMKKHPCAQQPMQHKSRERD